MDSLYEVSADEIKMRYKNAHLKKLRPFYYNMTYMQCHATYCFILSNIYKHIRSIYSMSYIVFSVKAVIWAAINIVYRLCF